MLKRMSYEVKNRQTKNYTKANWPVKYENNFPANYHENPPKSLRGRIILFGIKFSRDCLKSFQLWQLVDILPHEITLENLRIVAKERKVSLRSLKLKNDIYQCLRDELCFRIGGDLQDVNEEFKIAGVTLKRNYKLRWWRSNPVQAYISQNNNNENYRWSSKGKLLVNRELMNSARTYLKNVRLQKLRKLNEKVTVSIKEYESHLNNKQKLDPFLKSQLEPMIDLENLPSKLDYSPAKIEKFEHWPINPQIESIFKKILPSKIEKFEHEPIKKKPQIESIFKKIPNKKKLMSDEEFFNRFPIVKKAIEGEQQELKLKSITKDKISNKKKVMSDEELFNRFPIIKKAIEREQQELKLKSLMKEKNPNKKKVMSDEEFLNRFPVARKAIEREQQVLKLRNSMKKIVEKTVHDSSVNPKSPKENSTRKIVEKTVHDSSVNPKPPDENSTRKIVEKPTHRTPLLVSMDPMCPKERDRRLKIILEEEDFF